MAGACGGTPGAFLRTPIRMSFCSRIRKNSDGPTRILTNSATHPRLIVLGALKESCSCLAAALGAARQPSAAPRAAAKLGQPFRKLALDLLQILHAHGQTNQPIADAPPS